MSSKNLLQLAQELQLAATEQEALLLELRDHPRRDAHAQSVLMNPLVDWNNDTLRQAVELGIESLSNQRTLLKQTLYMLGPINPKEDSPLMN